jgi:orotidine-5'-phosphate decarboxylase
MNPRERLIFALDRSDRSEILRLADAIGDSVGWMKVGLQAFVSNGPPLVRELRERGPRIFLDLKFHDIPNTAANAVSAALAAGADMTNVHAAGGAAMLAASSAAAGDQLILLGVTILTSLSDEELPAIGLNGDARSNVVRLARLCAANGLQGVVASPQEIEAIREACGERFVIVTPGIRGANDAADDQKRTLTAGEAVRRGASYIVVGRPITSAADPRAAAERIVAELA